MNTASSNGASLGSEQFRRGFRDLAPRIASEWPEVDEAALDATAGDLGAVVDLVARATQHSKTLVRKHLAEIAELNVPTHSPIQERLLRVLESLEAAVGPIEDEAARVADKVAKVAEKAEAEGRALARDVHRRMDTTERTLRGNFWTTLLVTLGLGVVAGLFLGRGHGRR
jgi:ElaB/YqjD/DUF883 family membrane-anchored ribosome-binding protein